MSKNLLLSIIIAILSLFSGTLIFFISKKYPQKKAEVFWTEPYDPEQCPPGSDGQACTGCNPDCHPVCPQGVNCCPGGSCTLDWVNCVCEDGYCKIAGNPGSYEYYCLANCPTNYHQEEPGTCTVTCEPCTNTITCAPDIPSPPPPPPTTPPPPPPPPPLECESLTKDVPDDQIVPGTTLTFTCTHSGSGWHHYNFRYTSTLHDGWQQPPTGGYVNNQTGTVQYQIPPGTEGATYTFQCQACDDNNNCTDWGQADGGQ